MGGVLLTYSLNKKYVETRRYFLTKMCENTSYITSWIVRSCLALTLLCALGLVTSVAGPKASAHAKDARCGKFELVRSDYRADIVVKGVKVGYVEELGDNCYNLKLHGHVDANPIGGQFTVSLAEAGFSNVSKPSTTIPQDFYLPFPRVFQVFSVDMHIHYLNDSIGYYHGGFKA